jgi:hypothetical protein
MAEQFTNTFGAMPFLMLSLNSVIVVGFEVLQVQICTGFYC